MSLGSIFKVLTFVICVANYGLLLYRNRLNTGSFDLASLESVGWFMACLGWFNVIQQLD